MPQPVWGFAFLWETTSEGEKKEVKATQIWAKFELDAACGFRIRIFVFFFLPLGAHGRCGIDKRDVPQLFSAFLDYGHFSEKERHFANILGKMLYFSECFLPKQQQGEGSGLV
jgi:hypothetical protein